MNNHFIMMMPDLCHTLLGGGGGGVVVIHHQ